MSAHGIPGAFSSALSLLWRWMLIAIVAVIVLKFVSINIPWFNQNTIKEKIGANEKTKTNTSNFFTPDAFNFKLFNTNNDNIVKPILAPSADYYKKMSKPYSNDYYTNENTADSNDSWIIDGSMWNQTETDWRN